MRNGKHFTTTRWGLFTFQIGLGKCLFVSPHCICTGACFKCVRLWVNIFCRALSCFNTLIWNVLRSSWARVRYSDLFEKTLNELRSTWVVAYCPVNAHEESSFCVSPSQHISTILIVVQYVIPRNKYVPNNRNHLIAKLPFWDCDPTMETQETLETRAMKLLGYLVNPTQELGDQRALSRGKTWARTHWVLVQAHGTLSK